MWVIEMRLVENKGGSLGTPGKIGIVKKYGHSEILGIVAILAFCTKKQILVPRE